MNSIADNDTLERKVLALLKTNARMPSAEIAERLAVAVEDVEAAIKRMEKEGVILGYATVIASDYDRSEVRAIIEVQVQPERDSGFDKISKTLAKFSEVEAVRLVSGHYDLHLEVVGKSLQDVAHFVARKLSSQDGVKSCQTLFLLKKYKEAGLQLDKDEQYERLKVVP
jgi:DNA-binding Lrp family transcriptional regulator